MYVCTCAHVIIIYGKRCHEFERKGIWEGLKGEKRKRNDVSVLYSQKKKILKSNPEAGEILQY